MRSYKPMSVAITYLALVIMSMLMNVSASDATDQTAVVSSAGEGVNGHGSVSTEGAWDCVKAAPQIAVVVTECVGCFFDWLVYRDDFLKWGRRDCCKAIVALGEACFNYQFSEYKGMFKPCSKVM